MRLIRIGGCRGSAAADVAIGAAVVVFIILPVFSAIMEKYIMLNKMQIIRDAVDMTNISAYSAINAGNLGETLVTMDDIRVGQIYRRLLAENLDLNEADLSPHEGSIVEGKVNIDSLEVYTGGLPSTCPGGTQIVRPAVHSSLTVPLKPAFYRQVILGMLGKEHVELKVHVDSDIPVNN